MSKYFDGELLTGYEDSSKHWQLMEKDNQIAILEKALELAVEKMKTRFECLVNDERGIVKQSEFMEYFKTKAKEMLDE